MFRDDEVAPLNMWWQGWNSTI